jgi:hypothetical protein
MPGPHTGRSFPIESRSAVNIVLMFFVLPILAGLAILTFTIVQIIKHGHEFTASDWFWQVGWFGLLGLLLMTALPATGYQEFQRRRRLPSLPNRSK